MYLGRRGLAAAAVLSFALIGGSSEALGQQALVPAMPVAQPAVARTVSSVPLQFNLPAPVAAAKPSLNALVDKFAGADLDEQGQCLATAVYFESMGEPLEGQLAVARVVINRAASGRYPSNWCAVVKQKAQFSFVRNGRFPRINASCQAWRKARAVAKIAMDNAVESLPTDVLWYHADYVAPKWRRNLTKVEKIGAHIFYRA
jgi:N-acetylmuramoyl-L-alanine amidase